MIEDATNLRSPALVRIRHGYISIEVENKTVFDAIQAAAVETSGKKIHCKVVQADPYPIAFFWYEE